MVNILDTHLVTCNWYWKYTQILMEYIIMTIVRRYNVMIYVQIGMFQIDKIKTTAQMTIPNVNVHSGKF